MARWTITSLVINEILKYLTDAGVLSTSFEKPAVDNKLNQQIKPWVNVNTNPKEFIDIIRYMKQQRLIDTLQLPDKTVKITITEKGKRRVRQVEVNEMAIPVPSEWDGRWRVVLFDIPERKRQSRDALVRKLKDMGFAQVQRSLWVFPFPCQAEIEFLKHAFQVEPYVLFAEMSYIDIHNTLAKHFRGSLP